jgi:DNA-binding MarR family transcriptional regulator
MPRSKRSRPLVNAVGDELRLYQNAVDGLDEAALVQMGVNRSDGRCLDLLEFNGPMTPGALATATGLSTGAVTALVDRLERSGFVRRHPHETDRRRVVVELTEQARGLVASVYGPLGADADPLLGRYSDEELALILDFLTRAPGPDHHSYRADPGHEAGAPGGVVQPGLERRAEPDRFGRRAQFGEAAGVGQLPPGEFLEAGQAIAHGVAMAVEEPGRLRGRAPGGGPPVEGVEEE